LFGSYRVDKQTDAAENITLLHYATPMGRKFMMILRKSCAWKLFHWIYLHRSFVGWVTGRLIVGWTCNVEWL